MKMRREEPRFDAIRQAVVKDLCKISSPQGLESIYGSLLEEMDSFAECPCPICLETARMAAETIVVTEEAMKMVPADSEAGISALVHKMHISQRNRFVSVVMSLLKAFVGDQPQMGPSVFSPKDLPPEIRERLFEFLKKELGPEDSEK